MTPGYDYSIAFLAGVLGSGHCVGMCGSLVSAFFLRAGRHGPLPHLAYHGGRLAIYTLVGAAAGSLGLAITSTGAVGKVQGVLQIAAGLFVILLGIDLLGRLPWRLDRLLWPVTLLRGGFAAAARRGPLAGALAGGVLNGLMPCAMTLAVAVKATTAGGPLEGGGLLLAFGAGTLPAMLFVSAAFAHLGPRLRGRLLHGAALCVIALGASTVYQGAHYFLVMRGLADW